MHDLWISIVNINRCDLTLDCLHSIDGGTHAVTFGTAVVHNATTDGSQQAIADAFPQVVQVDREQIQGFAANQNLGLRQGEGRYSMILNNDTLVHDGALDRMIAYMDTHPDIGALGPKLLNADGTNQMGFARFPHPLFDAIFAGRAAMQRGGRTHDITEPGDVDWLNGACIMVRREVIDQVGLMDEAFAPVYVEETDWCKRIHDAGWRVVHYPEAVITHLRGVTIGAQPSIAMTLSLYANKIYYFRKHHGTPTAALYRVTLAAQMLAKAVLVRARRNMDAEARANEIARADAVLKLAITGKKPT